MRNEEAIQANKKKAIVDAAVRAFARLGYHDCRVSDIANEADVAYGLVYHYFENKEEILKTIFRENWTIFTSVLRQIEGDRKGLRDQVEAIVSFVLESYMMNPMLLEVIVLEVTRSPRFMEKENMALFNEAFVILRRMIEKEKRKGGIRKEIDPRLASITIMGSLETVLNAYVLKFLESGDKDQLVRVKSHLVEIALSGILKGAD